MGDASQSQDRQAERRLIERARRGDRQALRELVDAHKDRLFAFIRRMMRNHHDAEEIVQDAFLKAFVSLESFSTEFRFSTWLFTIGYRLCLNAMRRKTPLNGDVDFRSMADGTPAADVGAAQSDEAKFIKNVVWSAVDRLSPPQRATVILFYRHEQSCQEIAQVLEYPVATVKSHLHRARAKLKVHLESYVSEDSNRLRILDAMAG